MSKSVLLLVLAVVGYFLWKRPGDAQAQQEQQPEGPPLNPPAFAGGGGGGGYTEPKDTQWIAQPVQPVEGWVAVPPPAPPASEPPTSTQKRDILGGQVRGPSVDAPLTGTREEKAGQLANNFRRDQVAAAFGDRNGSSLTLDPNIGGGKRPTSEPPKAAPTFTPAAAPITPAQKQSIVSAYRPTSDNTPITGTRQEVAGTIALNTRAQLQSAFGGSGSKGNSISLASPPKATSAAPPVSSTGWIATPIAPPAATAPAPAQKPAPPKGGGVGLISQGLTTSAPAPKSAPAPVASASFRAAPVAVKSAAPPPSKMTTMLRAAPR